MRYKKYRSKLEGKVALLLGEDWPYEKETISYTMERKYTMDFVSPDGLVCVEVKGFFRPGDQAKYIAVKEALEAEGRELVFLFSNSSKPVRKGAKLTHGKWCDKIGCRYYDVSDTKSLKNGEGYE